jgi:Domain of unknown function (DUF4307)
VTAGPPTRPAGRYGDVPDPRRRRLLVALAVAAVAAAVGLAGWVAVVQARSPVRWSDAGVRVVDDARTDVSYTVTTSPGRVVVCTVRALNDGRAVVGQVDATLGPSTQETFTVTTRVPTTERAAGAQIRACAPA